MEHKYNSSTKHSYNTV